VDATFQILTKTYNLEHKLKERSKMLINHTVTLMMLW